MFWILIFLYIYMNEQLQFYSNMILFLFHTLNKHILEKKPWILEIERRTIHCFKPLWIKLGSADVISSYRAACEIHKDSNFCIKNTFIKLQQQYLHIFPHGECCLWVLCENVQYKNHNVKIVLMFNCVDIYINYNWIACI